MKMIRFQKLPRLQNIWDKKNETEKLTKLKICQLLLLPLFCRGLIIWKKTNKQTKNMVAAESLFTRQSKLKHTAG